MYYELLRAKIADGSAVCGVVGLGYVGLPLAVEMGNVDMKVMQHRIVKMNQTAKARQHMRLEGVKGHVVAELKHRQCFARGKRSGLLGHDVYCASV